MASRLLTRHNGVKHVPRKHSQLAAPTQKRQRNFRLRVFFPEMPVTVLPKGNLVTQRGRLQVKVPRHYTKPEIKQYMSKVYGLGIMKVNTMNYGAKIKRKMSRDRSGFNVTKTTGFKKAIVTVDNTMFLDLLADMNVSSTPADASSASAAADATNASAST